MLCLERGHGGILITLHLVLVGIPLAPLGRHTCTVVFLRLILPVSYCTAQASGPHHFRRQPLPLPRCGAGELTLYEMNTANQNKCTNLLLL
jgi:hypothetical protein